MSHTVLLIEDNEQDRYLSTHLLEHRGYTLVSAYDGPSGIEWARTVAPSLILLDIQLPVMDGYSVARALREVPTCQDVSIVAMTSYAMAGDREKALASGCNGHIEEPIDPEGFLGEIERFLAHRSAQ